MSEIYEIYLAVSRWALPLLAVALILNWLRQYRYTRYLPRVYGALVTREGVRIPVTACESAIGRRANCDIQIPGNNVSRTHAVLTKTRDGFRISDTSSGGVSVNGVRIDGSAAVYPGDSITIGDAEFYVSRPLPQDFEELDIPPEPKRYPPDDGFLLGILTLFQLIMGGQLALRYLEDGYTPIAVAFGSVVAAEWVWYFINRRISGATMRCEIPTLFLVTMGLAVCASSDRTALYKQLAAALVGLVCCFVLVSVLKNVELTMKLRYAAAGAALVLLGVNLVFGSVFNGAANWIDLGFITIQPSELVKAAFIFAGAATLERLLTMRNLRRFLLFSAACMGVLVIIRDFGTLSVFFVTMMVIMIMRLGDVRVITGICAATAVMGVAVIKLVPYVSRRFEAWGRVWEFADSSGYQQTRTLMYAASGGLLGVGGGNGYLKTVNAADTDLVFGMLSEEWGGIIALSTLFCFVLLALYALQLSRNSRSAYYSISVCAAAGMFLFQTSLNAFGATDLLPLTGVTMPFVSNGGTSMLACFCIMAFFKAAELGRADVMEDDIEFDSEEYDEYIYPDEN